MVTSGSTFNNNGTLSFNGGQFLGESGVVFNHNPNAIIKGVAHLGCIVYLPIMV